MAPDIVILQRGQLPYEVDKWTRSPVQGITDSPVLHADSSVLNAQRGQLRGVVPCYRGQTLQRLRPTIVPTREVKHGPSDLRSRPQRRFGSDTGAREGK